MSASLENPIFQALGSTFRRAKLGGSVLAIASGQTNSLELPNSLLAKGITLRLTGNLVIAVANAAAVFAESPLGLIKNIQVLGDGRRQLVNSPARDLFRLAHITWGKQGELSPPLGTIGTRAFSATIRIDHEMLMAMDPSETLFDPRLFKKVELKVTWGAATDIATAGGGGTIALTNVQLDVLSDQTSEGVDQTLFDYTVSADEAAVVATSAALPFRIGQNGNLVGILIRCDRDAGGGLGPIPVDDLINSITIKSDQTVVHYDQVSWATLQRENVLHYGLDGGATAGAQIPGWVFVPFIEHGMISSCLNTNALNNLTLFANVTRTSGTETIHVSYLFLEPRRSLAQSVQSV